MGMASSDHCIIDHCSISWTLDEAFSSRGAKNITLQRTLISEALNEAGHKKYPPGTQHGYAASIGGDIGSFHHNLLAHCAGRNWSLAGGLSKPDNTYAGRLDLRNNVVYNWKSRATDGGAHEVNFVANYYKPGPATRFFYALNAQYGGFPGSQRYYFAGNVMPGHFGLTNQAAGRTATTERGGRLPTDYSPWSETPFFDSHVKTQTAEECYTNVLANVGCNFPALDEHDQRVIAEVRAGTFKFKGSKTGLPGLPDSQDDVGGWDNYPEVHRPADWDTDRDGMPDAWEKAHGLNPNDPADGNKDSNGDGYTNLEKYLNSLCRRVLDAFGSKPEVNIHVLMRTSGFFVAAGRGDGFNSPRPISRISGAIKAEAQARQAAADKRSDEAFARALPVIKEWEAKGQALPPGRRQAGGSAAGEDSRVSRRLGRRHVFLRRARRKGVGRHQSQ